METESAANIQKVARERITQFTKQNQVVSDTAPIVYALLDQGVLSLTDPDQQAQLALPVIQAFRQEEQERSNVNTLPLAKDKEILGQWIKRAFDEIGEYLVEAKIAPKTLVERERQERNIEIAQSGKYEFKTEGVRASYEFGTEMLTKMYQLTTEVLEDYNFNPPDPDKEKATLLIATYLAAGHELGHHLQFVIARQRAKIAHKENPETSLDELIEQADDYLNTLVATRIGETKSLEILLEGEPEEEKRKLFKYIAHERVAEGCELISFRYALAKIGVPHATAQNLLEDFLEARRITREEYRAVVRKARSLGIGIMQLAKKMEVLSQSLEENPQTASVADSIPESFIRHIGCTAPLNRFQLTRLFSYYPR